MSSPDAFSELLSLQFNTWVTVLNQIFDDFLKVA